MSGEQLPESTAHILIVDDLPDHLAFAGTILRQQGYRVHAATSGRAALAFLEKRLPDLIVLDIHIEGMDGLEPVSYTHLDVYKRQAYTVCSSFPAINARMYEPRHLGASSDALGLLMFFFAI